MTKTIFVFVCLLLLTAEGFSQHYIKGRVLDEETQQPLKGASVYINNTTNGTSTNDNGEFELGPFSPGPYEVIASFVGYTTLLYSVEISTTDWRIGFKLSKKEVVLREVLVLSDELRIQYLDIFKQYVIGVSNAAEKCEIKNIEVIRFALGHTKDEITAFTEDALVINNPEFGYTLYFDLLNFTFNKKTKSSYFYGYTRFVESDLDENTKRKCLRKRRQSYHGSAIHFFRSLVNKQLDQNGFTVFQLVNPKYDSAVSTSSKKKIGFGVVTVVNAIEDSLMSLYSDSIYSIYQLNIKDGWRVRYSKETDLKNEMFQKGFRAGQPPSGTLNGLRIRQHPVLVSEKGVILTPVNVFYDGLWAYERLANMLPEDYEPD